jgi:hypothetical protein
MFETIEQLKEQIKNFSRLLDSSIELNSILTVKCQKINSEKNELINEYNKLKLEHYNVSANFTQMYHNNAKLESQCKDAYERIQELENKDIEKICDGVNLELLNLCTKLSDENMLLIHKQPIPRGYNPIPKEKCEEVDIEPIYFTMNTNRQCFDLCEIKNDGTKIGSRLCCECDSCKAFNDEKKWIQCSERPDGKIKKRDKFGVISKAEEPNSPCDNCIYEDNDSHEAICVHCTANLKQNEYYSSK